MIAENLGTVRERIGAAARRCGRDPASVSLVAVTKTFGPERIEEALSAGITDFGENYVQELRAKRESVGEKPIRWHFIGHLQTNKVKYIADYVHLIHSVDSLKLAEEIHRRGERIGRSIDVLIEVHTTDEATKYGTPPDQVVSLARSISELDRINVCGLMTMGPFSDNPEDSRPAFRIVRELQRELQNLALPRVSARELSIGMTHDFEIAIEEGATIVRLGTALFGKRKKKEEADGE